MQYTLALLALAASVCAQGVTQIITPPAPAPTGCSPSFTGNFEINVQNVTTTKKRHLEKRVTACGGDGTLVLGLANGILMDAKGRTGYIADNRQFQFDGPPQTGAVYTAGFSVCANDTLALGGSAIFWQCLSGTFYNLYDESLGKQCNEVYINVIPCVVAGATTVTASSMSNLPPSIVVVTSPTAATTITSVVSSLTTTTTSTTSSVILASNSTVTSTVLSNISTANATGVLSSTGAQVTTTTGARTATTTTAAATTIASGVAGVLSAGKEFAALAAGVAALVMI